MKKTKVIMAVFAIFIGMMMISTPVGSKISEKIQLEQLDSKAIDIDISDYYNQPKEEIISSLVDGLNVDPEFISLEEIIDACVQLSNSASTKETIRYYKDQYKKDITRLSEEELIEESIERLEEMDDGFFTLEQNTEDNVLSVLGDQAREINNQALDTLENIQTISMSTAVMGTTGSGVASSTSLLCFSLRFLQAYYYLGAALALVLGQIGVAELSALVASIFQGIGDVLGCPPLFSSASSSTMPSVNLLISKPINLQETTTTCSLCAN